MLLLYGFTSADDFVIQRVLNQDGMNKLPPAKHLCKFYHLGDMFGIRSRICYPMILYSQSGVSPLFSYLA
jgi:hypothetical protein